MTDNRKELTSSQDEPISDTAKMSPAKAEDGTSVAGAAINQNSTTSNAGSDPGTSRKPDKKAAPATPRRPARLAVLVLALAAIGVALSILVWREKMMPALPSKAVDATRSVQSVDLTALESRVVKLAETIERIGRRSADLTAVQESIATLEARFAEAAARPVAVEPAVDLLPLRGELTRQADAIAGINARLASLEAAEKRRAEGRPAAALILAVGQLRGALQDGRTFTAELDTVRRIAGDDATVAAALGQWADRADRGIPTRGALQRQFPAAARAVLQAATAPRSDRLIDRMLARVSKLVTVRPTDATAQGDDPGSIVGRADGRLRDGDLKGAAVELDRLSGPAAVAVANWLADAKRRLAADDGMHVLHALAIARTVSENANR